MLLTCMFRVFSLVHQFTYLKVCTCNSRLHICNLVTKTTWIGKMISSTFVQHIQPPSLLFVQISFFPTVTAHTAAQSLLWKALNDTLKGKNMVLYHEKWRRWNAFDKMRLVQNYKNNSPRCYTPKLTSKIYGIRSISCITEIVHSSENNDMLWGNVKWLKCWKAQEEILCKSAV